MDVDGPTVLFISWYPRQLINEKSCPLCECLATNTSAAELLRVLNNFLNLMIYPETTLLISALMVQKQ